MMPYPIEPIDQIFVKDYGFCSFAKNMGKNISKNLSGKYSQKLLDHVTKSATNAMKTASKKAIQKTAEATCNLIGKTLLIKLPKSQKVHHKIILKMKQK